MHPCRRSLKNLLTSVGFRVEAFQSVGGVVGHHERGTTQGGGLAEERPGGTGALPANAGLVKSAGFAQLGEEAFLSTLFASRTTAAAWKLKPSWYAVSTQDRTTAPELQRFLANRMHANTIEVDSSHLSLITHPREITDVILNAAGRSG
jgi:hypothetical protein